MSGGWSSSSRRQSLPTDWPVIRRGVLARDGYACQWPLAGRICAAPANQCDHIDPAGGDDPSNLRALCAGHHTYRSSQQGGQAFGAVRKRMAAARFRPREAHPGLIQKESA